MSEVLTYEKAAELLHRAVAEKGADYVYEPIDDDYGPHGGGCLYFYGGAPSCIAGHVFDYLGFTADELEPFEHESVRDVAPGLIFDVDPLALQLLEVVQEQQDRREPWGDAVEWAERRVDAP